MLRFFSLLLLLPQCASGDRASNPFAPGWNGEAKTPPLGWRSWNAFGNLIDQRLMEQAMDALTAKNRTIMGKAGVSLCDAAGFCSVGVDEGWEACGGGINGTQHAADGTPTINTTRFPDMGKMVEYGHGLGLTVGWYENGCKCAEKKDDPFNYAGDVRSLAAFGFDGIKLDDCGAQKNSTLYAELMQKAGRNFTIENHKKPEGKDCGPQGGETGAGSSACPTRGWCPFNWFRSSQDITTSPWSWFRNLQSVIPFVGPDETVSQPSCWAYPDMLEVGRVVEPAPGTFYSWNRAHFGAWCIVSSPLILGMELSDEILAPVLDIIGNTEAIAVNQAWDGMPGMLVKVWQPSIIPDAFGGLINAALDIVGSSVKPPPPPPPPAVQLWAKRLGGGAMAVLLINASPTSLAAGTISIPLEDLNMTHASNVNVRDIWARTDWGHGIQDTLVFPALRQFDSTFLRLAPQ